jgi:hypothetical protein
MMVTNTLDYNGKATITLVRSFMVQVPGLLWYGMLAKVESMPVKNTLAYFS